MITLDIIRAALELENFDHIEAQRKMAPKSRPMRREALGLDGNPRLAATLMLLYPVNGALHFVLTKRRDDLNDHAGQISLPGGSLEDGEGFAEAALRETCEELGLCDPIELLGQLSQIYIPPTDFQVQPFVGYITQRPDEWRIDPTEVDYVIEAPLDALLDDSLKRWDTAEFNGLTYEYGWYAVQEQKVWGATAAMLSEFEWRLRACLG